MKKWLLLLPMVMLLMGCGQQEVFEQVEDVFQVAAPLPGTVSLDIPNEAMVTALAQSKDSAIYFCDGYTLTVQTLPGGDMDRTVTEVTGYTQKQITLLHTAIGEVDRYEGTWTCMGEGGDQVGRLILLDDGDHHYAVTVMAPADKAGELSLIWDSVLDSVTLDNTGTSSPGRVPDTPE